MRHPRLIPGARLFPLVAVAHGSRDPRAAATVAELLSAVRARAARRGLTGLDARAAFLDHCAPSLPQALGSMFSGDTVGPAVVVPLLLTAAYHSKADIPAQLAAASAAHPGIAACCAGTLGPHPLLTRALERRLREAGVAVGDARARAATSVVLAAAGSADPAANAAVAALAARWARERGWRTVVPAYASAAGPRPAEAVASLRSQGAVSVAVASYLLAPGHFADKIRATALDAGADLVGGILGAAPELADVVLDRYIAAVADVGAAGSAADGARGTGVAAEVPQSIVAGAQLTGIHGYDSPVYGFTPRGETDVGRITDRNR